MKKFFNFLSRNILIGITFFGFAASSFAIELDDATLTIPLNPSKNVTITPEQLKRGKRLFLSTCSVCHTGGITKTNPNVGLDTESLSLATPSRDNIVNLVSYFKDPYSFPSTLMIALVPPKTNPPVLFK